MKNTLLIAIIILLSFSESYSQKRKLLYPLSIGANLELKSGFNGVKPPDGRKSQIAFNTMPDIYFSAYLPYSERNNIGSVLELGYRSYFFNVEEVNFGDVYNHRFSYLTLGANLYLEGFLMGFNFGLPLSGDYGSSIDAANLNNLVEFKVGGMWNIYTDNTGRLNINYYISYMLTGIYRDPVKNDPMNEVTFTDEDFFPTKIHNPKVASINLGFSYLFNINY